MEMEMERETEGPALILYSFGLLDDDLLQIAANFANIYFTAVVGQIRNDLKKSADFRFRKVCRN
jgi:hypothetical protein